MKRTLLFVIIALTNSAVFGQKLSIAPQTPVHDPGPISVAVAGARTTAVIHDSLVLTNVLPTDTNTLYYISHTGTATDSGFLAGTNGFGYSGFAERYDFTGADSSVKVLGVIALFGGRVNPATTKTVMFKAWSPASPIVIRSTLSYSGFPGAGLDSVSVSLKNLGIGATADTLKSFYFSTPTAYLTTSFFVGYTINYNFNALGGDTIGLQTTRLGERTSPEFTISAGDTTVNDQNTIFDSTLWLDTWANLGFKLNFFVFPIVDTKNTLGVPGITRNNLAFLGCYPNPAVNTSNIWFSLAKPENTIVTITDKAGHTVANFDQGNMQAGDHTVTLNVTNLPPGDYLCILHTAEGDGIASKLTIVK